MKKLITQADELASRNQADLNTGYLLLAMIGGKDTAANLLKLQGLSDTNIRTCIRDLDGEARGIFDAVLDKAGQIALSFKAADANPLHLLAAMVSVKGSHATSIFQEYNINGTMIRTQAVRCLTGVTKEHGTKNRRSTALRAKRYEALPLAGQLQMQISANQAKADVMASEPAKRMEPVLSPRKDMEPKPSIQGRICAKQFIEIGRDLEKKQRRKRKSESGPSASSTGLTQQGNAIPKPRNPVPKNQPANIGVTGENLSKVQPSVRSKPAYQARRTARRFRLTADKFPLLSSVGRNLTDEASVGRLDEIIGRTLEMERIADVLNKRKANSPCLIGAAGVGKTAIVEGLALRLSRGEAPGLDDRVIIEIRPTDLLTGTGVRGALAERLGQLRQEVGASEGRVILFLDEIHGLLSSNDGVEAIQELKTALGRGELPCIATTTDKEYAKYIESDTALARRFTAIEVEEPGEDEAIQIMEGVGPAYCKHHNVEFTKEALASAVRLSARYLHERALPDKAIALLDLAGARARRRMASKVESVDMAHVLARQLGVPTDRIAASDQDRLLKLEDELSSRVIGHRHVLASLGETLRRNAAGFRSGRPIGSFLFLGPTGVGKTETAKALEEFMFPGGGGMIRLDMSEFSESHAVARLIGAPPGYVGHEEGGQLTQAVRRHPYSLVLLDEIEKAHPDVLKVFLQVLDEGRLTDGLGKTVVLENTVIVMTSNLGSDLRIHRRQVGFGAVRETKEIDDIAVPILEAVRAALPPELWNRIDEPLVFAPLEREQIAEIALLMLKQLETQILNEHDIVFRVGQGTVEVLIHRGGYDPDLGARPMRRTIQSLIEGPVSKMVLGGEANRGDIMTVVGRGGDLSITIDKM